MSKVKLRRESIADQKLPCLFCGGQRLATTEEHCPPRALFKGRQWPEGFVFPACRECNSGSSDDDVWVAFLAHLNGGDDRLQQYKRVLYKLRQIAAPSLNEMFGLGPVAARAAARRLNMRPAPGQTYRDLPLVKVPEAAHRAVGSLAGKLTKALYHRATGNVFPVQGGIMYHWFTNAQMMEHGQIPALEVLRGIAAMLPPVVRNGKDLSDQFQCLHSSDEPGELHVLQVAFGRVFGFVSMASTNPGQLESFVATMEARFGTERKPFTFVSSNDPTRLIR